MISFFILLAVNIAVVLVIALFFNQSYEETSVNDPPEEPQELEFILTNSTIETLINDNIPYETMEGKSYVYQMSKYVKNVEDLEEVTKLLKEVISEMKIYTAWSGYDVLIIKSYEVYRSAFDLYQPKLRVECILKTKVK